MKQLSYITAFICCFCTAAATAQINKISGESYAAAPNNNTTTTRQATETNYSNNSAPRQTIELPKQPVNYAANVATERTTHASNTNTESPYKATGSINTTANNNFATSTTAGSSYSAYSKSNPAIPAGVPNRYSPSIKQPFPYYTSGLSINKSKVHQVDPVKINKHHSNNHIWQHSIPYFEAFYFYDIFYDDVIFEAESNSTDNPAENASFDGYLVYDKDTLSGILTVTNRSVTLEQPVDAQKEYSYNAALSDKYLKEIALFKGSKELYMTRLADDDKRLWRIVHTGKLNIYDDMYSFLNVGNIDTKHLRVSFAAQPAAAIKNKAQFINALNKAYGISLKNKDYSWKSLFNYIDRLD